MSRKPRRGKSRRPRLGPLVVILLVGAAFAAWRLYPRYLRPGPRRAARAGARRPARRSPSPPAQPAARVAARLYFARIVDGKERLVAVTREVSGEAPARAALEELIGGEVPPGCERPLSGGVHLRGLRVQDGLATVDFGSELVSTFEGGSDHEGVVVYAIVNTLTSVPGVEQVQILVGGRKTDSIGGHVDVSGPLGADGELVVGGKDL